MARAPTQLPFADFCAIRATFDMFDARSLRGTVDFDAFMSVVGPAVGNNACHARSIWDAVCGDHEWLSYRELLAVLLPPIEDCFKDVSTSDTPVTPTNLVAPWQSMDQLDLSVSVGAFFQLSDFS